MEKQRRVNPKIISLIVIVLVVAASTAVYAVNNANKEAAETSGSSSQQTQTSSEPSYTSSTTSTSDQATATHKSGSYTESSSYSTPGGNESITVTATLSSDGTITDVSTTGSADRGDSAEYQERFLSAYKQSVVGKKIDAVSLSRVSGSSLTSNGFNRALTSIKADAQA